MRWWVAVAWIEELIREGQKTVDEVEAFFVQGTSVSADLRNKKISLATTAYDCGLGIRTIHEGRIGSSSTNNPDQWRECLAAAIARGRLATPMKWDGLPEAQVLAHDPLTFDPGMKIDPA